MKGNSGKIQKFVKKESNGSKRGEPISHCCENLQPTKFCSVVKFRNLRNFHIVVKFRNQRNFLGVAKIRNLRNFAGYENFATVLIFCFSFLLLSELQL